MGWGRWDTDVHWWSKIRKNTVKAAWMNNLFGRDNATYVQRFQVQSLEVPFFFSVGRQLVGSLLYSGGQYYRKWGFWKTYGCGTCYLSVFRKQLAILWLFRPMLLYFSSCSCLCFEIIFFFCFYFSLSFAFYPIRAAPDIWTSSYLFIKRLEKVFIPFWLDSQLLPLS